MISISTRSLNFGTVTSQDARRRLRRRGCDIRSVNVYVVDTGIRRTHQEFEGRVGNGFDAIGDGQGTNDCHGHGTLVAGIIPSDWRERQIDLR